MKKAIFLILLAACSGAVGEVRKVATLKLNDVGKVEAESVALEDSSEIAEAITSSLLASTNHPFASYQRGDNSWSITPLNLSLTQIKPDQGGGGIDVETGEYHFTVSRYWFDPDAERNADGLPEDYIVAVLHDTTFNSKDAVPEWSLYVSGILFGTVTAPIGIYAIDFGGGVLATLNPIEQVVYSAELDQKMDSKILAVTNTLSNVAFSGDYYSLQNVPDYEIRAVNVGGKLVYKLFLTNPQKE